MMSTKPYVSGSNYILKMSNYQKGRWTDIWDGLFWRFVDRQKSVFLSGGRTNFIVSNLQKMPEEKRRSLFAAADEFIDILEK
jgi:deoxyribodipyrimidine photolyase-related protein